MEQPLNRLVQRQVKRHFGDTSNLPDELRRFILDISDTYNCMEDDARLFQNSLDISSQELRDAYLQQKRASDEQTETILKIKKAISTLNPALVVDSSDDDPEMTSLLLESLIDLIDEHKKMEISLKESEFYLREILDSQEVGIIIIDAETFEISFINQKGASLYGGEKEDIIGKQCHDVICPTKYGECNLHKYENGYAATEKILLNAKGERIPILKSVVNSTFNNRKCFVESFIDITVRKQAEEEVVKAKEAAQSASIAKSDFLASMSHEIRTPLNGVIGFTDLLMKTTLNDSQQQYLSAVSQSANSLLGIINDILDFSKIEAGKLELDITQNDLLDFSSQVADMIKFQAHQKGLELLLNVSPEIPRFVMIDAIRLRQVLVNVLGNAVKFTHKGEIEFKIEYLGENKEGLSDFRFSVRDTGMGIATKFQEKIFEAFSQEDTSTSRQFGGTGLGLTISNKLLGLMGSKLDLLSEPGVGSTFSFNVAFKAMQVNTTETGNLELIRKVLIVDDNDHNRFILREILAFKDIKSIEAKNGPEAIKLVEAGNNFDAILMDYHMPGMDGIETIRQIRAIKKENNTESPVILLYSSSDDESVKAACTELKIHHRLVKPIKMQQLYDALSWLSITEKDGAGYITQPEIPDFVSSYNRDLTVLIVEDNSVNMFLIKTILADIVPNATLLEARNGKIAVEQYSKVRPDLIFMDIQMPVMNGYEASEAIRKIGSGTRVPIIALTAGTVKGEREKCLSFGMDDYITKPVVRDTIVNIIGKWLNPEMLFLAIDQPAAIAVNDMHFNAVNLKRYVGEDNEFLSELLLMAKTDLNNSLFELSESIFKKDVNGIKSIAHKMRGTALSACFDVLAVYLKQLESIDIFIQKDIFPLAGAIRTEIDYLNAM
jgi:PAS domain S-box-containing protein